VFHRSDAGILYHPLFFLNEVVPEETFVNDVEYFLLVLVSSPSDLV
jgi:hypothetical protein